VDSIEHSVKTKVLLIIIMAAKKRKDKILLFSRSIPTLGTALVGNID
jgi:hypothetical protein